MFKAISKWVWLRANKREPKPYEAYLSMVGNWFIIGMLFPIVGFMLVMPFDNRISWTASGIMALVVIVGLFIFVLISTILYDRKTPTYKAIHEKAIERWHSKRKEYGLE